MVVLRVVCASMNTWLSRVAPERIVFLKSDRRTRSLRLTPLTQAAFCLFAATGLAAAAGGAWIAADRFAERAAAPDSGLAAIYESRIDRLEAERIQLAEALSTARVERETALAAMTDAGTDLAAAEAAERRMTVAVDAHRQQYDDLLRAHEDTLAELAGVKARNKTLAKETETLHLTADEFEASLAGLSFALATTADQRDAAATEAGALSARVEALETAFAARADQQQRLVSRLEDAARLSLSSLEDVFEKAGMEIEPVLAKVRSEQAGEGGLFLPPEGPGFIDGDEEDARITQLFQDMERVNSLRAAIERLPLARPTAAARFTSGYGNRKDPFTGRRAFHGGIDLAAPRGTPIYAAGAGEVVESRWMRGYGNTIKIRHAFGYETVYAHLHRRRVKVGDVVGRGDRIGDMGNTGRSTGSHLHYEIRVNGRTVNPAKYIEAARHVL